MIAKEHITVGWRRNGEIIRAPIDRDAPIHLFGPGDDPADATGVPASVRAFLVRTDSATCGHAHHGAG